MKSRFFLRFARPFVRRKFEKIFENVRIRGEREFLARLEQGPLVVASNHVSFWDALLLVLLDERWGGKGVALMDRANLAELPFFAKAGAIPIDRKNAKLGLVDLERSLEHAKHPGEYVVIFPQGVERPASAPLAYRSGVSWLSRHSRLPVVPMAVRYDFGMSERPFVHVVLGEALLPEEFSLELLEQRTTELLSLVDAEVCALNAPGDRNPSRFLETVKRKPPSDRPLLGRILAWFFSSKEAR